MTRGTVGRRVVALLAVIGAVSCVDRALTGPSEVRNMVVAGRGEQLKFHGRGDKTFVWYLWEGALYTSKGIRLPLKSQQVNSLVQLGRQFEQIDSVMQTHKAEFLALDEADPRGQRLSVTQRAEILRHVEEATAQGLGSKSPGGLPVSAQDDNPCINTYNQYLADVQQLNGLLDDINLVIEQWQENCVPQPYDSTMPPPPPPTQGLCDELNQESIDLSNQYQAVYAQEQADYAAYLKCLSGQA